MWLIPIYVTAERSSETKDITDTIVKTTVGHVPSGSLRLYATVVAAYIMFGYAMYQILQELEWYIDARHRYLHKPLARHFAVFVRNIPPDYRTNSSLEAFFRRCFSNQDVLEARLAVNAPNLTKVVAQRETTLGNLEHSLALLERDGVRPRHSSTMSVLGNDVDSIQYYSDELEEQNRDINQRIDQLETIVGGVESSVPVAQAHHVEVEETGNARREFQSETPFNVSSPKPQSHLGELEAMISQSNLEASDSLGRAEVPLLSENALDQDMEHNGQNPNLNERQGLDPDPSGVRFSGTSFSEDSTASSRRRGQNTLDTLTKTFQKTVQTATSVAEKAAGTATTVASKATTAATDVANRAVTLVLGGDDGEVFPAGLVVFTKRSVASAALQMIHHPRPFIMEVMEAPDPDDGEFL